MTGALTAQQKGLLIYHLREAYMEIFPASDIAERLDVLERNAYVAGFSLLAAMGKAEARDLGLDGGTLYDSEANYTRVRGKFFDWDDDQAPAAQATRTVDTPAQDGSIPGQ